MYASKQLDSLFYIQKWNIFKHHWLMKKKHRKQCTGQELFDVIDHDKEHEAINR